MAFPIPGAHPFTSLPLELTAIRKLTEAKEASISALESGLAATKARLAESRRVVAHHSSSPHVTNSPEPSSHPPTNPHDAHNAWAFNQKCIRPQNPYSPPVTAHPAYPALAKHAGGHPTSYAFWVDTKDAQNVTPRHVYPNSTKTPGRSTQNPAHPQCHAFAGDDAKVLGGYPSSGGHQSAGGHRGTGQQYVHGVSTQENHYPSHGYELAEGQHTPRAGGRLLPRRQSPPHMRSTWHPGWLDEHG